MIRRSEQAAALLAEEVIAGRCPLKNWDAAVEAMDRTRQRVEPCGCPNSGCLAIGADDRRALIEQLCYGATTYKAIKERAVWPAVKAWLSPQQQDWIEQYAPERVELVTTRGPRKVKLTYPDTGDGAPPVLAARIQELYDVTGGLKVAAGRVAGGHPGVGSESPADPGHAGPGEFLARELSPAQTGTPTEISEA